MSRAASHPRSPLASSWAWAMRHPGQRREEETRMSLRSCRLHAFQHLGERGLGRIRGATPAYGQLTSGLPEFGYIPIFNC